MNKNEIDFCKSFFSDSPDLVNTRDILRYYLALNKQYQIQDNHMPLPLWRREGFSDQGMPAWEHLQQINNRTSVDCGISIYVHVPFCPSRCSFCDCLTTPLVNHRDLVLDQYLEVLLLEIEAWHACGNLSQRPVTTVHFGGGTPLFLGPERFQRLIEALRFSFNAIADTEWAIETTSSSLTESTFSFLNDIGFRRLHLGVQSMEEQVRPLLKRRETASQILNKIKIAQSLQWITSVDLLVGLPFETPFGFLKGIERLIDAGCDGFSVYEINISSQNSQFAIQYNLFERDRRENYFLFLAALTQLSKAGFKKNLFNHYANERDRNLYFTFPERSEDCLAIGAYADGVFTDYHYRHPDYQTYIEKSSPGMPVLEGGIRKSKRAKQLFAIEIAILSGEFQIKQFEDLFTTLQITDLLNAWEAALLVEQTGAGTYALTPNGAWFSGNMVQDLEDKAIEYV